jgi:hypothetical protein
MKVQTIQEIFVNSVEAYLNRNGESLYIKTSDQTQPPEQQTLPDEVSISEQAMSDIQNQES